MTTLDAFATDDGLVVVAECAECGSTHPLADRPSAEDTTASTACPKCGSPSYSAGVRDRAGEVEEVGS